MKLKIMLTGHNRRIAMDISEHLSEDRGCVTLKCPPKKAALFEMSLSEAPNVIIICLGDENADTVKAFDVLKEAARLGTLTIIVVAIIQSWSTCSSWSVRYLCWLCMKS